MKTFKVELTEMEIEDIGEGLGTRIVELQELSEITVEKKKELKRFRILMKKIKHIPYRGW